MNTDLLHTDLRDHVFESELGGHILRHPLIVLLYHDDLAEFINQMYLQKKEQFLDILEVGTSSAILGFVERPFRLETVVDMVEQGSFTVEELKESMLWVWSDSESPSSWDKLRAIQAWKTLGFCSDSDLEKPKSPMLIYRGGAGAGMSWTTDRSVAQWFANRFNQTREVRSTVVHPRHVLAQIDKREEHEVVVDILGHLDTLSAAERKLLQ